MQNNEHSPYNFTEEDIMLIMRDPKHLHKLMSGNEDDSAGFNIPGRRVEQTEKEDNTLDDLIKNYLCENEYIKTIQTDHPLLWSETIDAYIKKRMANEKYEDFKKRWNLERNKPVGQARDSLLEKQILMEEESENRFKEKDKFPAPAAKGLIEKYFIQ